MLQQLTAVWTFRYFWLSLVKMDLVTRYRRSFLGVGWSLLMPLAMTAVYCIVFSQLNGSDWKIYAQRTLAGIAVWELLRNSLVQGCKAFLQNEAYIRLSPLPYAIYPLRTVMGNAIHFLITMSVVVAAVAALNPTVYLQPTIWAAVPGIVLAMLFAWGIATIAAFATTYFHDISHLIEVSTLAMFFLTPVIYGRELLDNKGLSWLVDLNPIYAFVELIRDPIVEGVLPGPERYAYAGGLTIASVGLGLGVIGWLQKRVIFQL